MQIRIFNILILLVCFSGLLAENERSIKPDVTTHYYQVEKTYQKWQLRSMNLSQWYESDEEWLELYRKYDPIILKKYLLEQAQVIQKAKCKNSFIAYYIWNNCSMKMMAIENHIKSCIYQTQARWRNRNVLLARYYHFKKQPMHPIERFLQRKYHSFINFFKRRINRSQHYWIKRSRDLQIKKKRLFR